MLLTLLILFVVQSGCLIFMWVRYSRLRKRIKGPTFVGRPTMPDPIDDPNRLFVTEARVRMLIREAMNDT